MADLPSGLVTFLFTDIEGSTPLWEREPDQMCLALACHDAILRTAIASAGGHAYKTIGDAFQAAFALPAQALVAALAAQRAFATQIWETSEPVRVRMGVHVGLAVAEDTDYRTTHTLNRVARIMAAGHGGQILLSGEVADLVRRDLPADVTLRDVGRHRMKGLTHLEHLFQLVASDLPAAFPPLKTLDHHPNNLPLQSTLLIGREKEITSVCSVLRRIDIRLVTLTGPGGTGKTRLALQTAAELVDEFSDGVWFVNLAPINDPELAATTIAQTLGVRETDSRPLRTSLQDYLREKQLLLLLDNFEQVVDAAPLVAELLAAAPGLNILVTSRIALHLSSEHEIAVPSLTLPDRTDLPPLERLTQYEAVRLFVERAQAVNLAFQMTNANAPAVVEICHQVDGLPLAIELAAARSKLFPPQALLVRLGNRLRLLTGGTRDLPARQQTIRNTIDWSYNLLDATQQTLFMRLGVFVGGWTEQAGAGVCNAAGDISIDVLDGLAALLDQSLLQQTEGSDGEPRFTMLETIREYALERLMERGEAEAMRQRHAEYYLALAETAEQETQGLQQRTWVERLESEHDNLRAALEYLSAHEACEQLARLCAALSWFWWLHAHFGEARTWVNQVVARRGELSAPLRAKVLVKCAILHGVEVMFTLLDEGVSLYRTLGDQRGIAVGLINLGVERYFNGDDTAARAPLEEALTLSRTIGYKPGIAEALEMLGEVALVEGEYARAVGFLEESLLLFRALGNSYEISTVLNFLGDAAQLQRDYERAATLFSEALTLRQELGDRRGSAAMIGNLGDLALKQGNIAQAVALFAESLGIYRDIGWRQGIGWTLQSFGAVACALEESERAARLLGAEEALRDELGYQVWPTLRAHYDHIRSTVQAMLGAKAFTAAWSAGRALTLDQAMAEAESLRSDLETSAAIQPEPEPKEE